MIQLHLKFGILKDQFRKLTIRHEELYFYDYELPMR